MSGRQIEHHNIRSLTKLAGGSSYAVTLPIDTVNALGWNSKEKLVVVIHYRKGLLIQDWEED